MRIRKFIEIKCNHCKKPVLKELKEHTRQIKNGNNKFYCNLSCCAHENKIMMANAQKSKDFPTETINKLNSFPRRFKTKDEFSPFRYFIRKTKQRLDSMRKSRIIEFDIDEVELKRIWDNQKGICPYTNIKMYIANGRKDRGLIQASLDRIDSSKGYIVGNLEFVCMGVNFAKNSFSKQDMLNFVKQIKES